MPNNGPTPSQKTKVVLVGVGGATCSGKTTLAKHLKRILPDSVIIHQDVSFFRVAFNTGSALTNADWDAAPGAIVWPKLINFLREVKATGKIPADHQSHDHLNEQKDIKIEDEVRDKWIETFEGIRREREQKGEEKIIWGLVDGFLMYWNQEVINELDVRIFLRVPEPVLKQRRHERHGYHTAVQTDPEGSLWRDPPGYWEQIVYPAYVDAHRDVFIDGDVEGGTPGSKVEGLVVINSLDLSMGEGVSRVCGVLEDIGRN
ncbi:hypothetical protein H0H87_004181 [Tephrocybe sp. NHM501043]|nr:hypothetical protein H0H87_004181 [Tephrocybe sp. NHM501043]